MFQTTGDRAMKTDRESVTPDQNIAVLSGMAALFIPLVPPLCRALGVLD